MTLDEAIKHCEEVAEEQDMKAGFETDYQTYAMSEAERERCRECANKHRQLAEWLRELKQLRERTRLIPVSERLPEVTGEYLIIKMWRGSYSGEIYKEVDISTYDKRQHRWDCIDVIAWQLLPDPYKEDKE